MSQQKMITSFISTASVQKVSENVSKSISSENIESSRDVVFDEWPPNVTRLLQWSSCIPVPFF
jgi:hypothetical protein